MKGRIGKRCTVRAVWRRISAQKKTQGCVTFALSLPFQGRLCHAFSGYSCDSVKLVQDMEKIKTVISGRERCWNQFFQQNKQCQWRQAKKSCHKLQKWKGGVGVCSTQSVASSQMSIQRVRWQDEGRQRCVGTIRERS